MEKPLPKHIPALDGIRGIAILMVLGVHFYRRELFHEHAVLNMLTGRFASLGNYGVELFFVLSGFLITGILLDYQREPGSLIKFYSRRSLRIFPLYYLSLALVLLVLPRFMDYDAGANQVVDRQWWLWTYLMNWPSAGWIWDDSKVFVVGHFWSLCVEEHYYLFWPALVYLTPRRTLPILCMALICIGLFSRGANSIMGSATPTILQWLTLRKIDGLAVGSFLAIALRDRRLAALLPSGRAFLGTMVVAAAIVGITIGLPRRLHSGPLDVINETAVVTCGGLVLLAAIRAEPRGTYQRILTSGWLVALGKYSYGLYVIHGMLRPQLFQWFDVTSLPPFPGSMFLYQLGFYLFAAVISIGLALLSYHAVERPFLSMKRFFDYGSRRQKQVVVGSSV